MKGNPEVNQQMMAEPTSESTIGLDLGDRWIREATRDRLHREYFKMVFEMIQQEIDI